MLNVSKLVRFSPLIWFQNVTLLRIFFVEEMVVILSPIKKKKKQNITVRTYSSHADVVV